jgi:hypothetical protein
MLVRFGGWVLIIAVSFPSFSEIFERDSADNGDIAELPLLFGTHGDFRGESTVFEKELSAEMQDLWVAFAKNGAKGVEALGWPEYGVNGTVLQFGRNEKLTQLVPHGAVDTGCS